MDKNLFPIAIPVKPYIKKFIEVEYGVPTIITRRDIIGNKLYDVLHRRYTGEKIYHKNYSTEITLHISKNLFRYAGAGLKLPGIIAFNSFMKLLIKDKQRTFINTYVQSNRCQIQEAIMAFIDQYQSDGDDFNLEVIKKDYYRWRLHEPRNIFPTNVPSVFHTKKMTHAIN